ncbi:hypothetical protein FKP32DRAFT_1579056, partial [Trametes sanguinea]
PVERAAGAPITDLDIALRPSEAEYIPTDFIPRLVSIINFVEADANRFNVGLLPLDLKWGNTRDGVDFDRYLCHNGRPVTVWMVGIVTSTWLMPSEGTRVSIGVRLLCQRDMDTAKFIQFRLSHPVGDASYAGLTTFAKRYVTSRSEHVSFNDVYDGTDRLAAWSTMTKIEPARINKSDIVVVECYVKRFKTTPNRFAWQQWGVTFELLRIAQLLNGPGPANIEPEDSHVSL